MNLGIFKYFVLFLSIVGYSQSSKYWNEITHRKLDSLKPELTSEQHEFFNTLISLRSNFETQKRIDSSSAFIRIVEGYDFIKRVHGIKEEFFLHENKKTVYENNDKKWGLRVGDYNTFEEFNSDVKDLDYINPRNYYAFFGCTPNRKTYRKSVKIEKKVEKEGVVSENYIKIMTLINLESNQISISFLVPKEGKRKAFISYGPVYIDPQLEYWLD